MITQYLPSGARLNFKLFHNYNQVNVPHFKRNDQHFWTPMIISDQKIIIRAQLTSMMVKAFTRTLRCQIPYENREIIKNVITTKNFLESLQSSNNQKDFSLVFICSKVSLSGATVKIPRTRFRVFECRHYVSIYGPARYEHGVTRRFLHSKAFIQNIIFVGLTHSFVFVNIMFIGKILCRLL